MSLAHDAASRGTVPRIDGSRAKLRATASDLGLGDRIRTARLAAGMTRGALGLAVGVTFRQIHGYESGEDRVSAGTLQRIADAPGLHPGSFFDSPHAGPGARARTRADRRPSPPRSKPAPASRLPRRPDADAPRTDTGQGCVAIRPVLPPAHPTRGDTASGRSGQGAVSSRAAYERIQHPHGEAIERMSYESSIRDVRPDVARAALATALPCRGIVTRIHEAHGIPGHPVFYRAFRYLPERGAEVRPTDALPSRLPAAS